MDFGRPFVFMFEDRDWPKKLLVFSLISLIPILGQLILLGWVVQIIRNIIINQDETLPELNFEKQIIDGFKYVIIKLIYTLPIALVTLFPGMLIFFVALLVDTDESLMIGMGCFFFFLILYMVLILPISFLAPAFLANFAVADKFSAAFEWKNIFCGVKNHFVSYLVVFLGLYCANYITQLGVNLVIIGVIPATVYAQTIIAHFYAQAYKKALA